MAVDNNRSKKPTLQVVPGIEDLDERDIFRAISTVDTASGAARLRLRSDLETKAGGPGKILVRRPRASTWFPLYDMEWRLAQMMDGTRSSAEIAAAAAKSGVAATAETVRAFARELKGYGFLLSADEAAATTKTEENDGDERRHSGEVQQLLDTAVALQARGDSEQATNYLLAILEIDPANHDVREMLRQTEKETGARLTTALEERSSRGNDQTATTAATPAAVLASPAPPPRRRWLGWTAGGLFLLCLAGILVAAYVFRAREPQPAIPDESKNPHEKPSADVAAPGVIAAQLHAAPLPPVTATTAGGVEELRVTVGQRLAVDEIVATIVDRNSSERIARLQAEYDRLRRAGEHDRVVRFYLAKAKKKLAAARRNAKTISVVAAHAGRVERLLVAAGAQVSEGDALVTLDDPGRLVAVLPAAVVPAGTVSNACRARSRGQGLNESPCRLVEVPSPGTGDPVVHAELEDPPGTFTEGQWIELMLGPSPAPP